MNNDFISGEVSYFPNSMKTELARMTNPTVIYRYRVPITDRPVVRLPKFASALSVGPSRDEHDALDLWAAVDPEQPEEEVPLIVVGTGYPLPPDLGPHLGTVPHADGALIFHVFTVAPNRYPTIPADDGSPVSVPPRTDA